MRRCKINVVTFGHHRGYWPLETDGGRIYPYWYATRLARRLDRRYFATFYVEPVR